MLAAAPVVIVATWLLSLVVFPLSKTTVVLMPDPDGHVGQAIVSTEAGSMELSQAGQMTSVSSADAAPAKAHIMSATEVKTMFGQVLAVEPEPPLKFTLFFMPDSTQLVAASEADLDSIVSAIKSRHSADVGVHGHSDRVGSKAYNEALSLRRAEAVSALLTGRGVDVTILETSSHGEGNPAIPTADDVAEPRNRRVEVVVR